MKSVFILKLFLFCFLFTSSFTQTAFSDESKLIIITDLEPDDRIALHLLANQFKDRILMIGTTVMNSARKQALTKKLFNQLGLPRVPVYQGTGGTKDSYPSISSSAAAREYIREGKNILDPKELEELNHRPLIGNEFQAHLKQALEQEKEIEIVLLAPPTDLVPVLDAQPHLKSHIKHIHVMGGWVSIPQNHGEEPVLRTTYNWNMDPIASSKFLQISDISMTLYSSHMIKPSFSGGTINSNSFPRIIQKLEELKPNSPSLLEFGIANKSWNEHIVDKIPALKNVIGPYIETQFTPADPAVVIGMINPQFITAARPVTVKLDLNDLDPQRGFKVDVVEDPCSKIILVEKVDPKIFEEEVLRLLTP